MTGLPSAVQLLPSWDSLNVLQEVNWPGAEGDWYQSINFRTDSFRTKGYQNNQSNSFKRKRRLWAGRDSEREEGKQGRRAGRKVRKKEARKEGRKDLETIIGLTHPRFMSGSAPIKSGVWTKHVRDIAMDEVNALLSGFTQI